MEKVSKWWYEDCFDKITVQSDTYPELRYKNRNHTIVVKDRARDEK